MAPPFPDKDHHMQDNNESNSAKEEEKRKGNSGTIRQEECSGKKVQMKVRKEYEWVGGERDG